MNILKIFAVAFLFVLLSVNEAEAMEKIAGRSGQLAVESFTQAEDMRVKKLETYLAKHNWAMVAAIAGVESTFGKRIPRGSYNAWGWGIPTGARPGIGFDGWEDGIETVAKGLRTRYIDRGADTLPKIGRIYAPPSTTWAGKVRFFMNQIEETEVPVELALSI